MGRIKRIRQLCAAIAVSFAFVSSILAGTIDLRWDAVPNASGYRIYYGTESGTVSGIYPESIAVGNRTEATLNVPTDCTTWYIAVKAYNHAGDESVEFSNEISGWPRPMVRQIASAVEQCAQSTPVTIIGTNFRPGAQLLLDVGGVLTDFYGNSLIRVDSADVISCNEIEALISVEPAARGSRAAEVGSNPLAVEILNTDSVWGSSAVNLEILFNQGRWDINQDDPTSDGRIDGSDLSWLAHAYGSTEGEAPYNPDADLNGDGMVDGIDLAYLAAGFGLCWSGSEWTARNCS
jgi:hypothetical protein